MAEIVEKELWDHYSELPNPAWYEYINNKNKNMRLDLKTIAKIYQDAKAYGVDNVEIGASAFNNGTITLRFGYWEKINDNLLDKINYVLPDHLHLDIQLVDEDDECGELWNYLIIKK